jgi:hypothetical protein
MRLVSYVSVVVLEQSCHGNLWHLLHVAPVSSKFKGCMWQSSVRSRVYDTCLLPLSTHPPHTCACIAAV